MRKFPRTFWRL